MARTKQTAKKTTSGKTAKERGQERKKEADVLRKLEEWKRLETLILANKLVYAGWDIPVWKNATKRSVGNQLFVINNEGALKMINSKPGQKLAKTWCNYVNEQRKLILQPQEDPSAKNTAKEPQLIAFKLQAPNLDRVQTVVANMIWHYTKNENPAALNAGNLPLSVIYQISIQVFDISRFAICLGRVIIGDKAERETRKNAPLEEVEKFVLEAIQGFKKSIQASPSYSFALHIVCTSRYNYDPIIFGPLSRIISIPHAIKMLWNRETRNNVLNLLQIGAQKCESMYLSLWFLMLFVAIQSVEFQSAMRCFKYEREQYIYDTEMETNYFKWAMCIRREGWAGAVAEFVGPSAFWRKHRIDCKFDVVDRPIISFDQILTF